RAHLVAATHAELLHRTEVIGVADPVAQRFVDFAIELAASLAEYVRDVRVEVGVEGVVVQQRVVHVEQEHEVARGVHFAGVLLTTGSCQPPSAAISLSEAAGPQLPDSYWMTFSASSSAGSMIRHAASMPSSRPNSSASPRSASPSSRAYGRRTRLGCWRATSSTFPPRIASPGRFTRAPVEITTSGLRRKRK